MTQRNSVPSTEISKYEDYNMGNTLEGHKENQCVWRKLSEGGKLGE
jgi:hypothetical protein